MKTISSVRGFTNMKRKWIPVLVLSLLGAVILPTVASAQNNDFSAHYNRYLFYNLGLSARSAGMGGAYSALRGGELGLIGNPASLGFIEKRVLMLQGDLDEITGTSAQNFTGTPTMGHADTELWSVGGGFAYPFAWGGLGLTYNYRDDDSEAGPYSGFPTFGSEGNLDRHAVSFTAAYRYMEGLSFGYRYSYIDWQSDSELIEIAPNPGVWFGVSEDFSGHRNQVGLQYTLRENLIFGLDGYYGIGDWEVGGAGEGDADSWAVRGGVAWNPMVDLPLLLAMDIKFENRELDFSTSNTEEDLFGVHLGAEYEIYDNLYLRGGYQFEDFDYEEDAGFGADPSVSGFTGGLGYVYEEITLDYGFIYSDTGGEGDFMHVFGLSYEF